MTPVMPSLVVDETQKAFLYDSLPLKQSNSGAAVGPAVTDQSAAVHPPMVHARVVLL